MKVESAYVGAFVVDSLPFSLGGTDEQAYALKQRGVACLVGYLGKMNGTRLTALLDAGLAYMPVTLAGEYEDGPNDEILQLRTLGIPRGATVWLDLEGMKAFKSNPLELTKKINVWADAIAAGGWMPGLYVGVPQPFTSEELYALHVVRYWRGQGSIRDRKNALAEPYPRGWTMTQMYPSVTWGGVLVDANIIGQDYKACVPSWVIRA